MLRELQDKGASFSVDGDKLIVETKRQMTDEQRSFIKNNKPLLIKKLHQQRCTKCIHLFSCSCARNTSGVCGEYHNFKLNKDAIC